jgi:hypothetical protein
MMLPCMADEAALSAGEALKLDRIVDSWSAAAKRGTPASFCKICDKTLCGEMGEI